jgi:hypothetical protein
MGMVEEVKFDVGEGQVGGRTEYLFLHALENRGDEILKSLRVVPLT